MKIDFKKLEDEEVIFVNEPWTPDEQAIFSAFLKAEKAKRLLMEEQKASHMTHPSPRARQRSANAARSNPRVQ